MKIEIENLTKKMIDCQNKLFEKNQELLKVIENMTLLQKQNKTNSFNYDDLIDKEFDLGMDIKRLKLVIDLFKAKIEVMQIEKELKSEMNFDLKLLALDVEI
ncbi:hypothetical protein AFAEC_1124 [Aliarcobacter faecis]|uniref:hypothetical protein n=1 Tax=Aliarcobacter faecis TaxID=1564138 RepID=UPI00047E436F|nr:hypothetical protein [Aliarcobacter faecis]QKF73281.1 hypothetical protein AFAEC_1115 [Aliarcobacter faecis]QKF73290.1 hypothetical protein AFAEC_1124 [Aliarcobacter faecis]